MCSTRQHVCRQYAFHQYNILPSYNSGEGHSSKRRHRKKRETTKSPVDKESNTRFERNLYPCSDHHRAIVRQSPCPPMSRDCRFCQTALISLTLHIVCVKNRTATALGTTEGTAECTCTHALNHLSDVLFLRRRRMRASKKDSFDDENDTSRSTSRDSKDNQAFSRKYLKWLKSLHLSTFREALRDKLGVTTIDHLFHKEDDDFRSVGMDEEQVEIIMTEVMHLLEQRAGETAVAPPVLKRRNSRGLVIFKAGVRDSDESNSPSGDKAKIKDQYELLEARNASLSQQVSDLKEANNNAKAHFEAALQEERNVTLKMQRKNVKLKHRIAENTNKTRDEESRLLLEIKTLQTELREASTTRKSDTKTRSDVLETRNASLSQQVSDLKEANNNAKAHFEAALQETRERFEADLTRLKDLNNHMETKAKQTAQRETHQANQLRAKTQDVSDLEQQLASLYTAYQMLQKEFDKLQQVTREKQAQQEQADFSTASSLDEIQKKHAAAEAAKRTHQMQLTKQTLKYYESAASEPK